MNFNKNSLISTKEYKNKLKIKNKLKELVPK